MVASNFRIALTDCRICKKEKSMNIRIAALSIFVLFVIMGLFLVQNMRERVENLADGKELLQRFEIGNILLSGIVDLSFERSLTQVGNDLPTAMPDVFMQKTLAQRARTTEKFDKVEAAVRGLGNPDLVTHFLDPFKSKRDDLAALRRQADQSLAATRDTRDAGFVAIWPYKVPEIVQHLANLRRVLLQTQGTMPPLAGYLNTHFYRFD